jgi:UDP-2,3-diacylglucosamine pyrophosphatase LpxH
MKTAGALDRALERATRLAVDDEKDRTVILSDQHRGDGERGSDDFRLNREVCAAALRHYLDDGFRLVILGDIEELWECDFPEIAAAYPEIYTIEREFHDLGRLFRVHGNHDLFWRRSDVLTKFLAPLFPGVAVHESVLLEGAHGSIFLTHGHQGEFFSDRLWRVSRLLVRHLWKPLQRLLHVPSTGAAKNVKKRNRRELEYYGWAKQKKLLFIAGHTHRALFASLSRLDRLRSAIDGLERRRSELDRRSEDYRVITARIEENVRELTERTAKEFRTGPEPVFETEEEAVPCYFNDGCCSYTNGLTAIEIDGGIIRLVKWDRDTRRRRVYEHENLRELFRRIRQR